MTAIADTTADAILVWCGVVNPTPTEVTLAEMCADAARSTIRHYRQLDVAPAWKADTAYTLGDIVQPTHPNEHLYKCTTAGTSDDDTEPEWSTDSGETITDGTTLVWTEYVRPFEARLNMLAIRMGVYLYQKLGVDGVTSFSENGIQRSYEKGDFPPSLLAQIPLPATTG